MHEAGRRGGESRRPRGEAGAAGWRQRLDQNSIPRSLRPDPWLDGQRAQETLPPPPELLRETASKASRAGAFKLFDQDPP